VLVSPNYCYNIILINLFHRNREEQPSKEIKSIEMKVIEWKLIAFLRWGLSFSLWGVIGGSPPICAPTTTNQTHSITFVCLVVLPHLLSATRFSPSTKEREPNPFSFVGWEERS